MASQPEYILAGVVMKQLLAGEQTAGAFSLFENSSTGPSSTPIHIHANDDETLYVLEGEMRAIIAGKEHSVRSGESVFLPRGVAHQLMNVSDSATRYLLFCTPSGFEGFLAEGGRPRIAGEEVRAPSSEDLVRLKAAAPRFGISLLAAW